MAYIGQKPGSNFRDVSIKDSFTGDGSTVAFDLAKSFSQADVNGIEVFVDNVRQEPTVAYTVGQDGSGNFKRVTFTAAPAASASIYVLNPGVTSGVLSVSDGSVTAAKIGNDAVSEEHLDVTSITGHPELAEAPADTDTFLVHDASAGAIKKIQNSNLVGSALITGKDEISIGGVSSDDVILIYDTSAGVLKKITKSAFDALQPAFSSVSPSNLLTGDGTGNYTIVITGTDFDSTATFKLVTNGGTDIALDTVTRDSSVQLTGTVAKNTANLTNANEPFDIVITNGNGLSVTSANAISIDAQPIWSTASGNIANIYDAVRSGVSISAAAADPESGGDIVYTLESGSLPAGLSLSSTSSGAVISGTANAQSSNTTSTFTIRAKDVNSNISDRQFNIVVYAPVQQSFTSSGTFSVPSGVTAVNTLVVAGGGGGGGFGGGGGAGGLIYRPLFPVTPGGTVTVTVGDGGAGANSDNSPGIGSTGQDSVFGTLTAKGGGYGGGQSPKSGGAGGSGGGSGRDAGAQPGTIGPANQPTQPGDSGTYGFGNPGGIGAAPGGSVGGGGGGGAGAVGAQGSAPDTNTSSSGNGGIGKAYTIADGTTSVYYAGGGGGAFQNAANSNVAAGGQGGGGRGGSEGGGGIPNVAVAGTANRGGGGGSARQPDYGKPGGKGIVIVQY